MVEKNPIKGVYAIQSETFGEVGFKFGMATWYILSKDLHLSLNDMQDKLGGGDISVMIDIFKAANIAYCNTHKCKSLSEYEIADLFDEIGVEEMSKIMEKGMETFGTSSNSKKKKPRVKDKPLVKK